MIGPASPVAATGLGAACALGPDLAACVDALFAAPNPPGAPTRFPNPYAAPYPLFEAPAELTSPRPGQTPTLALALAAAREALDRAGLDPAATAGLRVAVVVGTSVGATMDLRPLFETKRRGRTPDPARLAAHFTSNPALALGRDLGLSGPHLTLTNACTSGADALGAAAALLRSGRCDVALAGGADVVGEPTYCGFIRLLNTAPEPCRPFDAARKGLNLGDGAAFAVLETPEHAAARGVRERGRLLGYGAAEDAHHLTAPHPEGRGLARALHDALAQAGSTLHGVGFVNAHATATEVNDKVEAALLGRLLPGVPVWAVKGATGHTLGAAGALEAVLTWACLARGEIPASHGFETPDPELDLVPTTRAMPLAASLALSQSLGFGGQNAALALGPGREDA